MKFKFIYTSFFALLLAVLTMSNENGRAAVSQKGSTGAPGDNDVVSGMLRTCQGCHAGSASIQVSIQIEVLDGATAVTSYEAGKSYTVRGTVKTDAGSPAAFGLQMVALRDSAGLQVPYNAFSAPSSNAKLTTIASAKRSYLEQKTASTSNVFEATWKAPASGNVTFYASGNGVNNNNASGGDAAAKTSFVLAQPGVSAQNLAEILPVKISPNPVSGEFWVKIPENSLRGEAEFKFFNGQGKLIFSSKNQIDGGVQSINFSAENWNSGIYFLQIHQNGRAISTQKVLKM
jgi:hypothetical protein